MSADLILHNLKVIAGRVASAPNADIIAIRGNKIVFVGPKAALGHLRGARTRMLDCQGSVALPGFNDAHCHPVAFAITQRHVDCAAPCVRSIADVQSMLRKQAAESKHDRWIRGANLNTTLLAEKRLPTRWELDAAVPNLPVVLVDRAGQYCILNTVALRRCGIGDDTRRLPADSACVSHGCCSASGVFYGNDARVAKAIPPLSEEEFESGVGAVNRAFLSHGVTSIQDASWSNGYRHWQALKTLKERGLLTSRITMLAGVDALQDLVRHNLRTGAGDTSLRLGGMKLALDESTGSNTPPQADLDKLATDAHLAGFQLAFHVPNITLLRMSLRTIEVVAEHTGHRCVRPRFEHCPACPTPLLPALARSGAIVVSQPCQLWEAGPAYLSEAADDQLQWAFSYRSYADHGIALAFSSDAPLNSCNPLHGIETAVTRRVEGGARLCQHESVSLYEALNMYTRAGAYCSNEEALKGSLAPGQLADVILLDGDGEVLLNENFFNAKVLMTLIDGKVVWTQ